MREVQPFRLRSVCGRPALLYIHLMNNLPILDADYFFEFQKLAVIELCKSIVSA